MLRVACLTATKLVLVVVGWVGPWSRNYHLLIVIIVIVVLLVLNYSDVFSHLAANHGDGGWAWCCNF